jgi:hypothetical protein
MIIQNKKINQGKKKTKGNLYSFYYQRPLLQYKQLIEGFRTSV